MTTEITVRNPRTPDNTSQYQCEQAMSEVKQLLQTRLCVSVCLRLCLHVSVCPSLHYNDFTGKIYSSAVRTICCTKQMKSTYIEGTPPFVPGYINCSSLVFHS